MKISKKTEYGLRAMVYLAKNQNRRAFSIREISNDEGVPFDFLGKIFADLERAKLVKAKHGINGGYFLARPAGKINVNDIMLALKEDKMLVNCALCKKNKKCASKNVWNKLKIAINKTLQKVALSQLI